jgi:hypothetical protein
MKLENFFESLLGLCILIFRQDMYFLEHLCVSKRGSDIVGDKYLIDKIIISYGKFLNETIERSVCMPEGGHK